MKRIHLLLIISLLTASITPPICALSSDQIKAQLLKCKNLLTNEAASFGNYIQGKPCDPKKKKIYRTALGLTGISTLIATGGGIIYVTKEKQRENNKQLFLLLNTCASNIQQIIDHGANVNCNDSEGNTPLHLVQQKEIATILIAKGAHVNSYNKRKKTPLHKAACHDRQDIVELLIKFGAEVNSRDLHGTTPLHEAAELGRINIAQFLITQGADINAQSEIGTPLHYAIYSTMLNEDEQYLMVNLLLTNKADPTIKSFGETLLEFAQKAKKNKNLIKLLQGK